MVKNEALYRGFEQEKGYTMATRFEILADELNTDPLGRGYSGMTDAQAAADINTLYRDVNYPIPASELELTIREFQKWANYRGKQRAEVDVDGEMTPKYPAMSEFMDLFFTTTSAGGSEIDLESNYMAEPVTGLVPRMEAEGSMGPSAAAALLQQGIQTVSRGTELNIGDVKESDVNYARTL